MAVNMKKSVSARSLCVLAAGTLVAFSLGCGWSTRQSRSNTQTGVSESGYPGGGAADPGSPALESMRREEKKGMTERDQKKEAGGPGAKTAETHASGKPAPEKK